MSQANLLNAESEYQQRLPDWVVDSRQWQGSTVSDRSSLMAALTEAQTYNLLGSTLIRPFTSLAKSASASLPLYVLRAIPDQIRSDAPFMSPVCSLPQ
jgi:hypothetical protein